MKNSRREKFQCKQCGRCCMLLHDAYSFCPLPEDIALWKGAGRNDILAWVCFFGQNETTLSEIADAWFNPISGEDVKRCPWLRKLPKKEQYYCRIHELKPDHCRRFPKSLSIAKKIGCKGLKK